jgi:hypothetical protein
MQQTSFDFLPHEGVFLILFKDIFCLIMIESNIPDKILNISGRRTQVSEIVDVHLELTLMK